MLGPLFFYDLLCTARRGRLIALRCAYALVLLIALFGVYASWFGFGSLGATLSPSEEAAFATDFFFTFLAAQLTAVLLLTPVYTSSAIAEEREAGRLDFLLTTELSNREIVLGKFAARLGSVGLVLLTGLPVLALLQFLGGVDPNLVLAGFAATLATMLSVGSFGVFVSAHCQKASSALWLTYLGIAVALISCGCIPGLNLGHPAVAYNFLVQAQRRNDDLTAVLAGLLIGYVANHGLVAFVCLLAAINLVRPSVNPLFAASPPAPRPLPLLPPRPDSLPLPRPRVSDDPLLWKELYLGGDSWAADFRELLVACGFVAFTFLGVVCVAIVVETVYRGGAIGVATFRLARLVGVPFADLMLLCIGLRAAASVSREREQSTLDSLLTLPLDRSDLLWAKWLGSLLSVRLWLGVLLLVWLLCTLAGGLHPLAGLLLAVVFLVHAGCSAALGLWCSVIGSNRRYATLLTLLGLLLWHGVPWLLPPEFWPLSPVVGLWELNFPPQDVALRWGEFTPSGSSNVIDKSLEVNFACMGAVFAALAGRILWRLANHHFEAEVGEVKEPRCGGVR